MSQKGLTGLTLLSIEREVASNIDLDKLIDTFASASVRCQRKFSC